MAKYQSVPGGDTPVAEDVVLHDVQHDETVALSVDKKATYDSELGGDSKTVADNPVLYVEQVETVPVVDQQPTGAQGIVRNNTPERRANNKPSSPSATLPGRAVEPEMTLTLPSPD